MNLSSFSIQIKLLWKGSGLTCFKQLIKLPEYGNFFFAFHSAKNGTLAQVLTWVHHIAEFHRTATETSRFCPWKIMILEIANGSLSVKYIVLCPGKFNPFCILLCLYFTSIFKM